MGFTRVLAPVAAMACVTGMLVVGWTAAATAVTRAPQAAPAARSLPAQVFAPYYFNTTDTLAATLPIRPAWTRAGPMSCRTPSRTRRRSRS